MQLPFFKMQGAGNRILVIDRRGHDCPVPAPAVLRQLADGSTGAGFDQLMWVGPAADADLAASYRVFNADGSEVEQCGNGVRCVAVVIAGESPATRQLRLQGPAGPVEARLLGDGRVSVTMGVPEFEPARVPFIADAAADRYDIEVAGIVVSAGSRFSTT